MKYEQVHHPTLVFEYRNKPGSTEKYEYQGELYSPNQGVEVPPEKLIVSYNQDGFRPNSSNPPYEIVVIGDSFIETGDKDNNTFSEYLKSITGRSTYNLGRSWYRPFQYIELLKIYGLKLNPKYVMLCFFAGNDIEDIREYKKWINGANYYTTNLTQTLFERYVVAIKDTISFVFNSLTHNSVQYKNSIHPDLGVIFLNGKPIEMMFKFWNEKLHVEELLIKDEWKTLRSLLLEFRDICKENSIIPIVVFILTKLQVYGELHSQDSGKNFLDNIDDQLTYQNNSELGLKQIAEGIDIRFIDLMPYFQTLANKGELLYYPFDTHWNAEGRQQLNLSPIL